MADYISREAASDLLAMSLIDEWEPEYAQDRLSEIPAADVRPVKIGHYVTDEMGDSSCSECGEKYLDITKRFCPECGAELRRSADMREKDDGE